VATATAKAKAMGHGRGQGHGHGHFEEVAEKWLADIEAEVEHVGGSLPYTETPYDRVCKPGLCRSDPLWLKASEMHGVFHAVCKGKLEICTCFFIGCPNSFGYLCMLAHVRQSPRECTFVSLEVRGHTLMAQHVLGMFFPWSLKISLAQDTGLDTPRLDFKPGMQVFLDVCRQKDIHAVEDVVLSTLSVRLETLLEMEASGIEATLSLTSAILEDLRDIADNTEATKTTANGDVDDLRDIAEPGPQRGPLRRRGAELDEEEGHVDEYEIEPRLRGMVVGTIRSYQEAIHCQEATFMECLGADPNVDPFPTASASASSSSTAPPQTTRPSGSSSSSRGRACAQIDWTSYGAYISEAGVNNHTVRNSSGTVMGNLKACLKDTVYMGFATCMYSAHRQKCSRGRTWKVDKEPLERVNQIIAKWLLDQHLYSSTADHTKAPRA
jgi:hypothetical protein